jgi:hypothetical protein
MILQTRFHVWVALSVLSSYPAFGFDGVLRVHQRRDSATQAQESGDRHSPGQIILQPTDPATRIGLVEGHLTASIALPKRGAKDIKAILPKISFQPKNTVVSTGHFRVEISPSDEAEIDEYLRQRDDGLYEPGKRFEPVLEVRGFTVNGEPATAAVIVPTYLEYQVSGLETDHTENTVVFDAIYLPHALRAEIVKPQLWKTDPSVDTTIAGCQISLDKHTDRLTFRFLNTLRLETALRTADSAGGMKFIFDPTNALPTSSSSDSQAGKEGSGRRSQSQMAQAEVSKDQVRKYVKEIPLKSIPVKGTAGTTQVPIYSTSRPDQLAYRGRNYRFNWNAPASNSEMPFYLGGVFTHTGDRGGRQKNVAAVDVKLNISDKLAPLGGAFNFGDRFAFAPSFFAKMNTAGVVNDENSAVWLLPLSVTFLSSGCCKGEKKDQFRLPWLRRVSLYAGYRGEAARVTDKRTHGGFAEARLFFANVRKKSASYRFEGILGWEVGRYKETTSNAVSKAGVAGPATGPDGKPIVEMFEVRKEGTLSRLHGGVHSTLAFGPGSSLTANYDLRQLLRPETFFDSDASIKGYFTPYNRSDLPSTFATVDQKLAFLASGTLPKGTRRYLDVAFNQEVTKFFDVRFSYTRGELAPSFQFVNKFEVTLALKILGKDSMAAR